MPAALTLCGIEITEPARFVSYHANGLTVGVDVSGGLDATAYLDAVGIVQSYTDPATDSAPWYDPGVPASVEFLGILTAQQPTGYDSPAQRTITPRGGYIQGGSFDPEQLLPREHAWNVTLFASSPAGLDYGKRWLSDALGAVCSACGVCDTIVRLYAPDTTDDWEDGRWIEYEVAATDGPHYQDYNEYASAASFTLVAGNSNLYKEPVNVINGVPLVEPTAPGECMDFETWFCGTIAADDTCMQIDPPLVGTLAPVILLDAADGPGSGIHVLMYDDCPGGVPGSNPRGILIPQLLQGWTLAIDSAKGVINATDPDGNLLNGSNMVTSTGGIDPFVLVSDCDQTRCICVGVDHPCNGGDNVLVSMDIQFRTR